MTGKADAVRAVTQQFKDRTNTIIEGVMAHLRDDNAKEILGPGLSPLIGRGTLRGIVTLALYADVLRVVRDMTVKDGTISDDELAASSDLLSALAESFAKVRAKDYAPFLVLSSENTRAFLAYYEDDAGFFGYRNEGTRWAGRQICRNIKEKYKDSRPLSLFGAALSEWAQMIAASDGVSQSEQSHLQSLASFLDVPHNPGHAKEEPSQPTTSPTATADAAPLPIEHNVTGSGKPQKDDRSSDVSVKRDWSTQDAVSVAEGRGTESTQPVDGAGNDFPTSTDWYYSSKGKKLGPVSERELRVLAASGELTAADLVWQVGQLKWVSASSVPELFPGPPPLPITGRTHLLATVNNKWKVPGIIGGALLLVLVLIQSMITNHNRRRQAELDFKRNEIRVTLSRVEDMFNALPINKDVHTIERELEYAASMANDLVETIFPTTFDKVAVPKMFWINVFDFTSDGHRRAQRSVVLEAKGANAYFSTLGGDSGDTQLEYYVSKVARQLAEDRAVICKPIATAFWELCAHKLRTGTSVDDIKTYALRRFFVHDGDEQMDPLQLNALARVVAESDTVISESLISNAGRQDLDRTEIQDLVTKIAANAAEKQVYQRFNNR